MSDESIDIFISYAHEDEILCSKLIRHLSNLKHRGIVSEWFDRKIMPGDEWNNQVDLHLTSSKTKIILLLVSSDFMASSYCQSIEVKKAMERHHEKTACVVPVILRPVDWHESSFYKLKALPRDGVPVTTWKNQDEAFLDIVKGIKDILKNFEFRTNLKFEPDTSDIDSRIQQIAPSHSTILGKTETAKILREIENSLQKSEWKFADQKTSFLLCRILEHSENNDVIGLEEVHSIPCSILNEVNRIWAKNSSQKFGFSVQKKAWLKSNEEEDSFYEMVGWKINNRWLSYDELYFEIHAPVGHFPTLWTSTKVLRGFRKFFFSHLENCNI